MMTTPENDSEYDWENLEDQTQVQPQEARYDWEQQRQEQPVELITATPVEAKRRKGPSGPIVHAVQAQSSHHRRGWLWCFIIILILGISLGVGLGKANGKGGKYSDGSKQFQVYEPAEFSFETAVEEIGTIPGTDNDSRWGAALALSADGTTLAIGAPGSNSNAPGAGLVQILTKSNDTEVEGGWVPLGIPIKGDTEEDTLGKSVAISADGRIVAIGIPSNDVGGLDAGLVRVFRFDDSNANGDTEWVQIGQGLIGKASEAANFGASVALSEDGLTLAAASTQEGYVIVYRYDSEENSWNTFGILEGKGSGDRFGESLALSGDGLTVSVGAPMNDGGIGYVRVSRWYIDLGAWVGLGDSPTTLVGDGKDDNFGSSVALSHDGNCIAIGANQFGLANSLPGFVRVFCLEHAVTTWNQIGDDILGSLDKDIFGESVSLSADASLLVVGAPGSDGNGSSSGQIQLFGYDGTSWVDHGHDGTLNSGYSGKAAGDQFGSAVAISADGSTFVGGAFAANGLTGDVQVFQLV